MAVDKKVISEKLQSLERCLERIKQHTPPSVEILKTDFDKQDLVCLNLQRAVQISVDIASHILAEELNEKASTMAEVFLMLSEKEMIDKNLAFSLAKSIGFRNIAVHEYDSLDMDIVYAIITKDLNVFYDFAKTVLKIIK